MSKTLKFAREKETKNKVRYMEVTDEGEAATEPIIGTLYVSKSLVEELEPGDAGLNVTIEKV